MTADRSTVEGWLRKVEKAVEETGDDSTYLSWVVREVLGEAWRAGQERGYDDCRDDQSRAASAARRAEREAPPVWAQRCSCGGQGIVHLSAERHEPVGPADVDPFAGKACPMCGEHVTGPCPVCAPLAVATLVRVREARERMARREYDAGGPYKTQLGQILDLLDTALAPPASDDPTGRQELPS